jgi:hypothetical protein
VSEGERGAAHVITKTISNQHLAVEKAAEATKKEMRIENVEGLENREQAKNAEMKELQWSEVVRGSTDAQSDGNAMSHR